ncbi:MAG TPA: DUF2203 domain-containing protein [Anaeromyxobacteraceae bacterium]|nr:DUF2203 domain-containing protein [Anaeromyxobacteraceae bacterium]
MADAPKMFTLEEANALVPTLQLEFGRVARLRAELGPLIERVGGADAAVAILQEGAGAPGGLEREAGRLKEVAADIAATVERVNELGCVVKDLDIGLVDFFSLRENEPVFLCWQFGEPGVVHWHPIDEGFAGRRPIEGIEVERPEFFN